MAIVLAALLAPACSSDSSESADERTSDERADASGGDEGSPSPNEGDPSGGDDSAGSALGDLADQIPGLENFGDCVDLLTNYVKLQAETFGGASGAADAQREAENLKGQLPEELHDDLDVVATAIGEVADGGLTGGTAPLETPEFKEADSNINAYFDQECGS